MADDDAQRRLGIGERIKQAREYLGFSQDDVAGYVGISRSAVSLLESGQRKIEIVELDKLSVLLERPITFFMDGAKAATDATQSPAVRALARQASKLSGNDLGELQRFAEFLESRSPRKRRE